MKRSLVAGVVLLLGATAISPVAARSERAHVFNSSRTSVPTSVRGVSAAPRTGTPAAVARAHLAERTDLYRFPDVGSLRVMEEIRHAGSNTIRFGQSLDGVPVFGAQYLVHMRGAGDKWAPQGANGHLFPGLEVDTSPTLSRSDALELAKLRSRVYPLDRTDFHGLTVLPQGDGVLTYHFTLWGYRYQVPARYEVFIDAHNGGVRLAYNNMQFANVEGTGTNSHGVSVPLNVSQTGSKFKLFDERPGTTGIISTHNAEGSTDYTPTPANIGSSSTSNFIGENTDSGAVDAHWGAGQTYDYYKALGRNSIDNNGMLIVSTVNVADPQTGAPMANAFWDGSQMVYGNPNPAQLHPFSGDLDVVGHELTHGVIEHSANLVYLNQPGAMNEAIADYFGSAIDVTYSPPQSAAEASRVGEDLCKVPEPSGWICPIRDLNDGRTTANYIYELTDSDNGGVHDNATIYAGALWDIREALGPRADQIIYRALIEFHTPLDKFIDGREAVIAAAQATGASESDIGVINAAFDAKGITPGWDGVPSTSDSRILARDILEFGYFDVAGPDLSGTKFVYASYGDKTQMDGSMQIFLGDLSGTTPKDIGESGDPSTLMDEQPAISGNKVAWLHLGMKNGGSEADIHWRTIGGSVRKISRDGLQLAPDVDGKTLVWEDASGSSSDIWMKRGSNKPKRIVGGRAEQWNPQIDGDWVVWWQPPTNGAPTVGFKNIKTGESGILNVKNQNANLSLPSVADGAMAWYEDADGDGLGAIRYNKLGTKRIRTLVSETDAGAPRWWGTLTPPPVVSMNGDFVAYSDETNFIAAFIDGQDVPEDQIGRDVFVVATSGGEATSVTSNRGDQAYPSMGNGSTLIWLDGSAGSSDIVTND